jgi:hypothetical protein
VTCRRQHGSGERGTCIGGGRAAASIAHPSGIASPASAAARTFTHATADDERSATTGSPSRRGAAHAIGLVPKNGRVPPAGAISDDELANIIATNPAPASCSTNHPSTPAELECSIARIAMPHARAASMSGCAPASKAGWQNPNPASTTTVAALGVDTTGTA